MNVMYTILRKISIGLYNLSYHRKTIFKKDVCGYIVYNLLCPLIKRISPKIIDVQGFKMFDLGGALNLAALGVYERHITDIAKEVVKPSMTVLNLGANIGYYTVMTAKLVGNTGKVIAIEPEPIAYHWLCKNIVLNDLRNVETINKAVHSYEGFISFKYGHGNNGLAECITVDSILNKADVIIMDIEGNEYNALLGMKNVLASKPVIFMECSSNTLTKILDLLEDYSIQILYRSQDRYDLLCYEYKKSKNLYQSTPPIKSSTLLYSP